MTNLVASITRVASASIGKKFIVALTGLAMVGFLVGHLAGNLLLFKGPDAINDYAKLLHDNKGLITLARTGLLIAFVLHIWFTIKLVQENRAARPVGYGYMNTRRATGASRSMIWSGLTVLAFVIYHLMHYTWGVANGYHDPANARYFLPDGRHNVYNMVVDGFNFAPAAMFYLLAISLLCWHLSHGVASCFQTLGLTTPNTREAIRKGSLAFSGLLLVGYLCIPLAVIFGIVK